MVVHIKTGAACLAYQFVSLLLFLLFAHCVLSVSCVSERFGTFQGGFTSVKVMQCIPNFTQTIQNI